MAKSHESSLKSGRGRPPHRHPLLQSEPACRRFGATTRPSDSRSGSALRRRGLRYRVNVVTGPSTRRRADIVFLRQRGRGIRGRLLLARVSRPNTDAEWWRCKLEGSAARDRATDIDLRASGWSVVRVWEHESPVRAAGRVSWRYADEAVRAFTTPASAGAPVPLSRLSRRCVRLIHDPCEPLRVGRFLICGEAR